MRRIALILVILASLRVRAQQPFIKDYLLNESAVNVKVNALVQDSTGYIWIGTDNGLTCFNGRDFIKIQDSIHKPVTAIAIGQTGIWVGYNNGKIGQVTNSFIQAVNIYNGPVSSITSLHTTGSNVLWASTEEQGVFVIVNHVGIQLNTANGLSDNFTYDLSINKPGSILAGSDMGINDISLINKRLAVNVYTTKQGLPDNIVTVIKNIPGTNRYWIGTQEGGIVIYDGDSKNMIPVLQPGTKWMYGQVNDILPVRGNRAWVATDEGYLVELKMKDSGQIEIHPYHYPVGKEFQKTFA